MTNAAAITKLPLPKLYSEPYPHAGYDSEGRELVWIADGWKMHRDVIDKINAEWDAAFTSAQSGEK